MKHALSRCAALLCMVLLFTGCASAPPNYIAHPADPFEQYNRSMTKFNDGVDNAVMKPVATAWKTVTPQPVRTGVGNFFGNLGDAWSFINNLLQFRGRAAFDSLVRFGTNSTLGLGGMLDIASAAGIERHKQDFGQTLGRWGVPTGPYLVLPLLGPSTVRDTVALPVDSLADALRTVKPVRARNGLYVLRAVNQRAQLLGATSVLDAAALDPYSFTRDVYLGLRNPAATHDGEGADEGWLPEEYD